LADTEAESKMRDSVGAYIGHLKPGQLDGEQMSPEQMFEKIRQLQKENEYLKRQREILKKAMSTPGEEPWRDLKGRTCC
jgi:hypothetical protein